MGRTVLSGSHCSEYLSNSKQYTLTFQAVAHAEAFSYLDGSVSIPSTV